MITPEHKRLVVVDAAKHITGWLWESPVSGQVLTGSGDALGAGYNRGPGNFVGRPTATNILFRTTTGDILSLTLGTLRMTTVATHMH